MLWAAGGPTFPASARHGSPGRTTAELTAEARRAQHVFLRMTRPRLWEEGTARGPWVSREAVGSSWALGTVIARPGGAMGVPGGLQGLIGALWVLASPLVSREGIRDPTFQAAWGLPWVSSALPAGSALGLDPRWVLTLTLAQPEIQPSWSGGHSGHRPRREPTGGGPRARQPHDSSQLQPRPDTCTHSISPGKVGRCVPGGHEEDRVCGPRQGEWRAAGPSDLARAPKWCWGCLLPLPRVRGCEETLPHPHLTQGAGGLSCGVRESPGPGRGQC